MRTSLCCLVLVLCATSGAAAQRTVKVGVLADRALGSFPFAYSDPASSNGSLTGFEVALLDHLCAHANWTCEVVVLPNLEDRLLALENNTIDWTISQLSFTPARALSIDFVRPFYYSSGVALFGNQDLTQNNILTAPGSQAAAPSWDSFAGRGLFANRKKLCFVEGYYALAFIVAEYKVNVEVVPTLQDAVAKVNDGSCAALAFDSVTPEADVGLPMLNVPPAYTSPFGVGIRRGDRELHDALALGLLDTMDKGVNDSAIMKFERDYLVKNGVKASRALANLVTGISSFEELPSNTTQRIPPSYSFLRPGSTGGGK